MMEADTSSSRAHSWAPQIPHDETQADTHDECNLDIVLHDGFFRRRHLGSRLGICIRTLRSKYYYENVIFSCLGFPHEAGRRSREVFNAFHLEMTCHWDNSGP